MVILATIREAEGEIEKVVGVGQYGINETNHTAEVALVVRDEDQSKGVGTELLSYLTYLAKREGLLRVHRRGAGGEQAHAPPLRKDGF